jgi:hypothetical protein
MSKLAKLFSVLIVIFTLVLTIIPTVNSSAKIKLPDLENYKEWCPEVYMYKACSAFGNGPSCSTLKGCS